MARAPTITRARIEAAMAAIDAGKIRSGILRDPRVPGLALAVGRASARWTYDYKLRLPGGGWSAGKRLTLGDLAGMDLDAAREAAAAVKAQVAAGIDPQAAKAARRQANVEASASQTVGDAIDRFVEERSPDWAANTRVHFRGDFGVIRAALGKAPLVLIQRPALAEFIRGFLSDQRRAGASGVRRAERIAQLLAAIWRQAGPGTPGRPGWEWPGVDPAVAAALPVPGKHRLTSRKRVLDEAEIRAAWPHLAGTTGGNKVGRGPRLVLALSLATGLRVGAVAATREADLHLDPEPVVGARDSGPWIRLPAIDGFKFSAKERREGADVHLPLSPLAVRLWREALAARRGDGPYVFEGHRGGPLSPNTVSKAWTELAAAGVLPADTTAHDARRSMRTHLAEIDHPGGHDLEEMLIGHSVGSTVARTYDRARKLARLRPLADAWGARLAEIVAAPPPNVTRLRTFR